MGNRKGFTLIELMITVSVMGILAIVLIPKANIMKSQIKSTGIITNMRLVKAQAEITIVNSAKPSDFATSLSNALNGSIINPISQNTNIQKINSWTEYQSDSYWKPAVIVATNYNTTLPDSNNYLTNNDLLTLTGIEISDVTTLEGSVLVVTFPDKIGQASDTSPFDVAIYAIDTNGKVIYDTSTSLIIKQ